MKTGFLSHAGKNIVPILCCWLYNSASMYTIKLIRVVSWAALNTGFKKVSDLLSWQF
jgi:hypothetical protein